MIFYDKPFSASMETSITNRKGKEKKGGEVGKRQSRQSNR